MTAMKKLLKRDAAGYTRQVPMHNGWLKQFRVPGSRTLE
jgi:hypothetical protein